VVDARVVFDEVDPDDPALAPSDHFGLVATVAVRAPVSGTVAVRRTVSGYCSPASPDPRPPGAGPRAPG
jgi:hypothetical protein